MKAFCFNTLALKTEQGVYLISPSQGDQTKLWIERGDGEGGEFDVELVFKLIDKMYKENF